MTERRIQRVFVVIPDPRKFANGGNWRSRQKFTEIIRLATILTKMSAINYNFFENHHAHDCIFRALVEERTRVPNSQFSSFLGSKLN